MRKLQDLAQITTQSEPGCLLFEVREDLEDPNRFVLWEEWTGEAALANHFTLPHTIRYKAQNLTRVARVERLQRIVTAAPDGRLS
ncbi:antibiotic biosynthesis monooxygenase [Roseibium sp. RKSG952]|nr:antibiotic biosynthesis monooxygenase [Roseibium sp. RKSG952]